MKDKRTIMELLSEVLMCIQIDSIDKVATCIKKLEALGYDVDIHHFRYSAENAKKLRKKGRACVQKHLLLAYQLRAMRDMDQVTAISPNGGVTTATLSIAGSVFSGSSICSLSDNFYRRRGLAMALGRAFNNMCEFYKTSRKEVEMFQAHRPQPLNLAPASENSTSLLQSVT